MLKLTVTFLCFAALAGAQIRTEVGEINGAPFRIDVPEHWNGTLIVYCHGYSTTPVTYDKQPAKTVLKAYLDTNAAVAQSAYSAVGWAIQQATVDTESLRRYFVQKYGQPKRTFVSGHSMGGFLTMMLMETQPTTYNGGLSLCGPLVPAGTLISGAFNARVVFDYFFPGVLPDPSHVPSDFKPSKEGSAKLEQLLGSKPEAAAAVRRYMTIKNNKDVAAGMDFVTYVLKDIQERSGGNPFDNRGTIYTITGADNELNEGVKRYAADPGTFEYLRIYYTPSGRLVHPLLQVHTTYDPLVSPNNPNAYTERAAAAGSQQFYAQQFVEHDGHCNVSPEETSKALGELTDWVEHQKAPEPGLLKAP
jgi:pimeloyl-ACP methyl ester carboxylesterase